jgi:hypothetical protein
MSGLCCACCLCGALTLEWQVILPRASEQKMKTYFSARMQKVDQDIKKVCTSALLQFAVYISVMANVNISEQKLTHVQVNSDGGVDWMSAPIPAGEVRPFAKDVNTAQLLEFWGKGECGEEPFRVRTDMPFAL